MRIYMTNYMDISIGNAIEESLSRNYFNKDGEPIDGAHVVAAKIFKMAAEGDYKAIDMIEKSIESNRIGGPQDYC